MKGKNINKISYLLFTLLLVYIIRVIYKEYAEPKFMTHGCGTGLYERS